VILFALGNGEANREGCGGARKSRSGTEEGEKKRVESTMPENLTLSRAQGNSDKPGFTEKKGQTKISGDA